MYFYYAQLNEDNICTGISILNGEVEEYNYWDKVEYNPLTGESILDRIFISRMIPIEVYSQNYIGLQYNEDNIWTEINNIL